MKHNGFYIEEEDMGAFGFLENIAKDDAALSAYDYLHGYCNVFANLLAKKYHYDLEEVHDYCNVLVHSYCTTVINGVRYFIDVRGITDDYKEFISEFDDLVEWKEHHTEYQYPAAFT